VIAELLAVVLPDADARDDAELAVARVAVREYYREKLGYHQDGPYVSKRL